MGLLERVMKFRLNKAKKNLENLRRLVLRITQFPELRQEMGFKYLAIRFEGGLLMS